MNISHTAARVVAPARLHLGFLDPGAALGRRFGSIGLAIDGPATSVLAVPHDGLAIEGEDDARARRAAERVVEHYGLPAAVRVVVEQAIPGHAGLGSGTQLALAVGTALTGLLGAPPPAAEIGAVLGRGRRSGIGLSLFERGGLVVDAGHGPDTLAPPVVSRVAVPEAWRVVLVLDRSTRGLSGGAEIRAFEALAPLPAARAAHLCHLTLMRLLPAAMEGDFEHFAAAVGEIQAIVGDHFAAVQAGRYTSARVARAIACLEARCGLAGVGQSSWGPTGFAFAPDAARAEAAVALLRDELAGAPGLDLAVCTPRNRGAELHAVPAAARRRASG